MAEARARRSASRIVAALVLLAASWASALSPAAATQAPLVGIAGALAGDMRWETWRARFVTGDGRVVDNVNGGITHSESQGYGMLLALAAGDRETFDQIWRFTRNVLFVRADGLAAWRYEVSRDQSLTLEMTASGRITDFNSATDGDILIAWALAEAADAGYGRAYLKEAARIAAAVERAALFDFPGFGVQVSPGAEGFSRGERGGRPVVNLSYWIFPAFPRLEAASGSPVWRSAFDAGLEHVGRIADFPVALPPDWMSLDPRRLSRTVVPGMDQAYSYNAIRVPLYLAMLGPASKPLIEKGFSHWFNIDGPLRTVDVMDGRFKDVLADPGYESLRILNRCVVAGGSVGEAFWSDLDQNYYPATLQMLAALAVRKEFPQCA